MISPAHAIVVCTYNRQADLRRCLESILPQLGDEQLIVIDDGSTDETPSYLSTLPERPGLKRVRVANQGLSINRDLGARLSSAPWITYVDDDAWLPEGWFSRLRAVCARLPTEVGALGGEVRLPWRQPPPAWLHPDLICYLTRFAPCAEATIMREQIPYVGANMTLHRRWLEKSGGFAHGLGRRGGNLLSREETQLWNRLRAIGAVGYYDPDLWLWHDLPSSRLRRRWFLRRLYWEGVSWEIETASSDTTPVHVSRRGVRAVRRFVPAMVRGLPRILTARTTQARFRAWADLAFQLGASVAVAKGLRAKS